MLRNGISRVYFDYSRLILSKRKEERKKGEKRERRRRRTSKERRLRWVGSGQGILIAQEMEPVCATGENVEKGMDRG